MFLDATDTRAVSATCDSALLVKDNKAPHSTIADVWTNCLPQDSDITAYTVFPATRSAERCGHRENRAYRTGDAPCNVSDSGNFRARATSL
jgi:hypothetical protein